MNSKSKLVIVTSIFLLVSAFFLLSKKNEHGFLHFASSVVRKKPLVTDANLAFNNCILEKYQDEKKTVQESFDLCRKENLKIHPDVEIDTKVIAVTDKNLVFSSRWVRKSKNVMKFGEPLIHALNRRPPIEPICISCLERRSDIDQEEKDGPLKREGCADCPCMPGFVLMETHR